MGFLTLGRPRVLSSGSAPDAPGAGVRGVVDLREVLKIEVSIYLRRADIGMTQKLLYAAQVAARLEQMGGERVAEHVRVHVHAQAPAACPQLDTQLYGPRGEPPSRTADEDRLPGPGLDSRPMPRPLARGGAHPARALRKPIVERLDGEASDRDDA